MQASSAFTSGGDSCGISGGAGGAWKAETASSAEAGGAEKAEADSSVAGSAARSEKAEGAPSFGAWKVDSVTSGEGQDGGVFCSAASLAVSFPEEIFERNILTAEATSGAAAKAAMAASAEKLLFSGTSAGGGVSLFSEDSGVEKLGASASVVFSGEGATAA